MDSRKKVFVYFIQFLKNQLEIFLKIAKTNKMVSNFGNWDSVIAIRLTFVKKFIYWDAFIPIVSLLFLFFFLTAILVFIVKLIKDLRNSDSDISIRELFLVFLTFLGPPIVAVFVVKKMRSFFLKILSKILNSVIGAGLFCGFITTSTVGLGYFFVVGSFFFEDNQRRVAAMTGFVTGQFVMFTSVYHRPLHQGLVQPHCLILLFLGSFFLQLFWTSRKTLRNAEFLDPQDLLSIKRKRVLRLQLQFLMTFFVQLCNPYLEPDSMIPRLVNFCLSSYKNDNAKNVFFVRSSFAGWFIGHIFFIILFMKFFEFLVIITIWVRKNFFES